MAIEFVDLLDSFNQKYDNTTSGLAADNAQDAIDELAADLAGFSGDMAISTEVDQLTVAAAVNTLYVVTTGATNGTCTVNLPTPTSAGARLGVIFHAENTDTDKVVISPAASDEIDGSTADIELTAPGEYLYLRADGDGTNWYTYSSTSSGTAGGSGVASGAYQLISNKSYSAVSEVTIDLTGYDSFLVRVINYVPSSDGAEAHIQVSEDSGSTWKSGASDYAYGIGRDSDTASGTNAGSTGDSKIILLEAGGNDTGEHSSVDVKLMSASNGLYKTFHISGARISALGTVVNFDTSAIYKGTTNVIDALRLFPSTGTMTCQIIVYGIGVNHERFGVSSQFSGAMVKLTSDESISSATWTSIPWDAEEYDVGDWWSAGSPTRLTVPAGVNKVRLTASISGTSTTDNILLTFNKNGAIFYGAPHTDSDTNGADSVTASSPAIDVVEGDYFEARVYSSQARTLTAVVNESTGSNYFGIEAVGLVGTTIDKCRAYLNTAQDTANSTIKVLLDTTSYDTGGMWDVTNKRFVPTKAGYYYVGAHARTATTGVWGLYIYKNGARDSLAGVLASASVYGGGGSAIIYCNGTTDYLELYVYSTSVRALTTGSDITHMEVVGPIVGTPAEDKPYNMAGFYSGAPTASLKLVHVVTEAVRIPSGMTGSQGTAETSATAQTDFDVQKNGSSVGTMRFAAAGTTATFIMASATDFAAGDKMQLVAPASPDSTLADVAWTFKGTRT